MLHSQESYLFGSGKSKKSSIRSDGNIDVDIVLGTPSKNCQYHGICKIDLSTGLNYDEFMSSKKYLKNSLKAVFQMDEQGDLIIKFDCQTITTFIENKYFSDDLFIVNESVTTPDFVNNFFGHSFNIEKGMYRIEKGSEYYQIKIKA